MNTRTLATRGAAFLTREDDGKKIIEGYFAVFGSRYELWEGAYETIAPEAFNDTLGDDIRALTNHNHTLVLGRTSAGTLTLLVDEKGLWGRIEINDQDQDAVNLYNRVKRGDVNQCSFGFEILGESRDVQSDGSVCWTLQRVKLYEVSVCTFPAYEETAVSARRKELGDVQRRKIELWRDQMRAKLKGEHNGTESNPPAAQD